MATNVDIKTEIQKLMPGQLVELYTLTSIDQATTYNFCNGTMDDGGLVEFNTTSYTALPVDASGWEMTGEGKLPRPKIKVSNVNRALQSEIDTENDLVGWTLTRKRTFYQFLDGGSSPDPTALFPLDTYIVDRKIKQNKLIVEWELVSPVDIENIKIPRKQAMGTCTHRYRNYVSGAFIDITTDPLDIGCPYVAASYWDDEGTSTPGTPENDNCGRRLKDCKLRQAASLAADAADTDWLSLPIEAFPNIKRFMKGR